MTYEEAIEYLYGQLPAFERTGASGYKPGLERVRRMMELMHVHAGPTAFIHVAGTNGKGSTAHTLAAIFQAKGMRTGLYTSPHIRDFRERIRLDGEMIPKEYVTRFVERYIDAGREGGGARGRRPAPREGAAPLRPTFFELTTLMAFDWLHWCGTDVVVLETGLGGRLDATNVVDPVVSVITNVSLDHTDLLGHTVREIAAEKAGIIKPGRAVVVGTEDADVLDVVNEKAAETGSEVLVAPRECPVTLDEATQTYTLQDGRTFRGQLRGAWQRENVQTALTVVDYLRRRKRWPVTDEHIAEGLLHVQELTGLYGRWTVLSEAPLTVFDTGHNPGAWEWLGRQISSHPGPKHVVVGFVADKDIDSILSLMPREAAYYFTQPSTPRALSAQELQRKACGYGLAGGVYGTVEEAIAAAKSAADKDSLIFIGGSNYLVCRNNASTQ